jgi:hypothetical protein
MIIKNVVIIRFSLKLSRDWQAIAYGSEDNRPIWFSYRMHIFINFLLNSLRNQTVKPVLVLLLMDQCDENDYLKFKLLISDIVTPIFSRNSDHFSQVNDHLNNLGLDNIAISRIDSDDIIFSNYFELLNHACSEALLNKFNFTYIVATMGYRVTRQYWQQVYYNCSPFLTIFCSKFNNENIYDFNHEDVILKPHIICNSARWIQVIHETNISNALLDLQFDTYNFIEKIKSNPKLIGTLPLAFSNNIPVEISPFINDIKSMLSYTDFLN